MLDINILLHSIGREVVEKTQYNIRNKPLVSGYPPANASGALAQSVRYEVTDNTLVVYAYDYIYYLVYGRGAGKFPPVEPIRQWVTTKLRITDIKQRNSIAYLIGRKIANEGTLIYKQGGSTLLDDVIGQQQLERWREDLMLQLVTSINSDILNIAA